MHNIFGPHLSSIYPHELLCAFDLHKVIFHRSFIDITLSLTRFPHKVQALKLLCNPILWKNLSNIRKTTNVGDDVYERLVEKHPKLALFGKHLLALENEQKPDIAMLEVIQALKQHGVKLYVLSNIGEKMHAALSAKYPDVFSLFDGIFIPTKALEYCQKPRLCFYEKFLTHVKNQGHERKHILFVDDKRVNVEAAAMCGISSILFSSTRAFKATLRKIAFLAESI